MIELRTALLLLGLAVFVVVVIVSYEKYRRARGRTRQKFVRSDAIENEPTLTRYDELEDNSQQLPNDTQKILLAPDLSVVEEVEKEGEIILVTCAMADFGNVSAKLEELGIEPENAELQRIPTTTTKLDVENSQKVLKLVGMIEDDDDVQNVFHNLELTDDLMAALTE